ncbi:Crp/Fnr family transcriptional regulator [Nitratireductor aquibiodomus]|uniref:Crp/Fnr family transcriptional regulator n=1 Tax=Nitratireductor aquibiodomus TaxID=204799 RepID=UPI0004686C1F|nr:Crp/Fnr family transcriptional regulator [Nitratireductor aquibiodomus]
MQRNASRASRRMRAALTDAVAQIIIKHNNRKPAWVLLENSDTPQIARESTPPREAANLCPAHFETLFSHCRPERYRAGDYLFMHEDPADRIYGVVSGTVEISTYSISGRKLVANIELSRSLIGEIGALDGGARTASAICLTDCELVSLSRTQLMRKLAEDASLALTMIELLCARLRWVSNERNDQALLKVEARLAKRLLLLGDRLADDGGWIRISQSELAAFLGATRESVNKMLNAWRNEDLIAIRRGAIRLVSRAGLQEIVHLDDE